MSSAAHAGKAAAMGAGATVGGAALAAGGITAAGFTSSGIVAGSLAATLQGAAVASGSLFAAAQSVAATGTLAYLGLSVGVGVVAGVAALGVGAVVGAGVGIHRAYTTSRRRHEVSESLSAAIWLCDVGIHFLTAEAEPPQEDDFHAFQQTLEVLLRSVRKHWPKIDDELEKSHGWKEPFVGEGHFIEKVTAPLLQNLSEFLFSLAPYDGLGCAIEYCTLPAHTPSLARIRFDTLQLKLSGAVQYWEELEDLLVEKYGWDEPLVGRGKFQNPALIDDAKVVSLAADLTRLRTKFLSFGSEECGSERALC